MWLHKVLLPLFVVLLGVADGAFTPSVPQETTVRNSSASMCLTAGNSSNSSSVVPRKPSTHFFDWTISWKVLDPDGLHSRVVPAINDQWPMPVLRVNRGDRVVVRVYNNLTNPHHNSSIHFHGMFNNGTSHMDGSPSLTQCATAPGISFFYDFVVDQPGTYWYHTHIDSFYPDGYRQLFLVDNDGAYFEDDIDGELSFTLSDWYDTLAENLTDTQVLVPANVDEASPMPNAILFNDTLSPKWQVEPGKTYRLRIASVSALVNFIFYIPGLNFTIVEVDGVYTEPAETSSVMMVPGQRYSLLLRIPEKTPAVYRMAEIWRTAFTPNTFPQQNRTGFLYTGNISDSQFVDLNNTSIYQTAPLNRSKYSLETYISTSIDYYDDMNLIPYDHQSLLPEPDEEITFDINFFKTGPDNVTYTGFNNIAWTAAKVPALYTVLSAPDDMTSENVTIYGNNTQSHVLKHNDVIQVVINNIGPQIHGLHLHGHNFQVISRGPDFTNKSTLYSGSPVFYNSTKANHTHPKYPVRRDTAYVNPYSYMVIRFRADNPGVWFFHCHLSWHLSAGMAAQFVEAPPQIRKYSQPVPQAALDACALSDLPYKGNAAGNTSDFFDLYGQNLQGFRNVSACEEFGC